jgi:hypothetical protein
MNQEIEFKKKKRKRDESYSSSSRSRSRSRSERKKSKKSKKKSSKSKSKREEKRKSDKSKKSSKKKDKKRSISSSKSSISEHMNLNVMPQGAYPFMYTPMGIRPMYDAFRQPTALKPTFHPAQPKPEVLEVPPDKIVKDQNFLNSDEKLFDSIINNEMHLRSVFSDAQISENYLGQTLYKTVKKFIYDPNTMIFDSSQSPISSTPKTSETVRYLIKDINDSRKPINLGNMNHIREQLYNYKNRLITEEINNI